MSDCLSWIIPASGEIELRDLDADAIADLADRGFQPYAIRSMRGSLLVVYAQKESDVRQIERTLEHERTHPGGTPRSATG
ncbi:MAG: hypothetical protein JWM41_3390 [Gemmatimonadetes bacterium]|nr:hypothetical protein [Gemmatimonadota bacterium]